MFCKFCGAQVADDNPFCTNCGAQLTAPEPAEAPADAPAPRKKPHVDVAGIFLKVREYLLSHRVIAIILAAAIFIGLLGTFTNWFGLNGPSTQIANAIRRTLTAKSFTLEFSGVSSYGSGMDRNSIRISGTIQVQLNMKEEEITIYGKLKQDGETMEFAIYDGYMITVEGDRVYSEDIQDELDEFFDSYEDTQEMLQEMIKDGQVDWEALLDMIDEDAYEEASEVINFKKLNACLKTFGKKMNNPFWLRKNAGYRMSLKNGMKTYVLEPDICDFLAAVLPIFKPAFRDRDAYRDLEDQLEELEDDAGLLKTSLSIGTRFGRLRNVELSISNSGSRVTLEGKFSRIGTTRIDTDELDELLDEATEY